MLAIIKDNDLILTIPINQINPPLSSSGKTRLIASVSEKSDLEILGRQLKIQVNAYIPA